MAADRQTYLTPADLKHPMLEKLSNMAAEFAGVRFLVVFPEANGWGQVLSGSPERGPDFCRVIQSSKEGAVNCRMCHILMAIAACMGKTDEQTCHAGASVLVSPLGEGEGALAILSTCIFAKNDSAEPWEELRERTRDLGLKEDQLKKAMDGLPRIDQEQVKLARAIMGVAGTAILAIRKIAALRRQAGGDVTADRPTDVQAAIEERLRNFISIPRFRPESKTARRGNVKSKMPTLINVVSELVGRKPNMPFTVSQIAAAARVTPNHFSSLFRQHKKQSFSAFLTAKRMEMAKRLLADLTLNIAEVATLSGYLDPGYFARVFRRETGLSPRDWRQALGGE